VEYFDRCYASNQNVLVHCRMGQSRSVSYVVAWAMLRFRSSMEELLASLNTKRYGIRINVGFLAKLEMIAEALGMKCTTRRAVPDKSVRRLRLAKRTIHESVPQKKAVNGSVLARNRKRQCLGHTHEDVAVKKSQEEDGDDASRKRAKML